MNFTFAICTCLTKIKDGKIHYDHETVPRIHSIIDSIERLKIPNYEILISGLDSIDRKNTKVVKYEGKFNSNLPSLNSLGFEGNFIEEGGWYPGHITAKKNLMAKCASYENIVFSHDYISYDEDWYDGYLRYGDNFKICCNKVLTLENERYMDWMVWPFNGSKLDSIVSGGVKSGHYGRECLIPYDVVHLSKYMYVQGSYWVAKKKTMLEFPLNENKIWGMGEDVEWSMKYRNFSGNIFNINSRSTCRLLKPKKSVFKECSKAVLEKLKTFNYG
jgi:hypothetical protein